MKEITVIDSEGRKHIYNVVSWSILSHGWARLVYKTGVMWLSPANVSSIYESK